MMQQSPEAQLPSRRPYAGAAFRPYHALESAATGDGGALKHPNVLFSPAIHVLCCFLSFAAGFRLSRLLFLLLFSPAPPSSPLHDHRAHFLSQRPSALINPASPTPAVVSSRVVVGRHGIRVRPWPHPDPAEVARANEILARVQQEQRVRFGVKDPRPVIVVTPTHARTFQALHLTGLAHSLMLVPYPVTWIVVEAGGASNETAALLARFRLEVIHLPFHEKIPLVWDDRHRFEGRMRLHALREIRERRLEGIVVFADDSNIHSMELFSEIQKVEWMGALSVEFLSHSAATDTRDQDSPFPIHGPECNSSGQLIGWRTSHYTPKIKIAPNLTDDAVPPVKLEWAGFAVNSRLLWKEAEGKPDWIRDLDEVGVEIESPIDLLKDASFVEPIGDCGQKVLLWWLRAEARNDGKFPAGWVVDPPLDIVVPAKRTRRSEAPLDLPIQQIAGDGKRDQKHVPKKGRSFKSKHATRNRKKREPRAETHVSI